jgi:hypothetical protein
VGITLLYKPIDDIRKVRLAGSPLERRHGALVREVPDG